MSAVAISALVDGVAAAHNLRRSSESRPYVGPCPFCGGSAKSDKFQIRSDGGWKCYACGESGDIITWLRKQEGLSCPDAHVRAEKDCQMADSCPAADRCRFGRKDGKPRFRRYRPAPAARKIKGSQVKDVAEIVPEYPPPKFIAWATSLQQKAQQKLMENSEQLAYLDARGIDRQTANHFGLGWLDHAYFPLRTDLGMTPVSSEGKTKVWIPEGLLIPITKRDVIHRLRVRRTPESRKRFNADLKYYWVKPSGNLPLAIPAASDAPRGAVIVEAELDAIAIAAAHPDVVVVGLGTVACGLDATLRRYLSRLPVILVALDAEQQSIDAVKRWQHTFAHARFWPTPKEKDAGDFYRAGEDLHAWIEAGLPPKTKQQEKPPQKILSVREQEEKKADGPEYFGSEAHEVKLKNGVIFYVTESEDIWRQYTAEGKAVFSRGELERMAPLLDGKTEDERMEITMKLIDTKLVFGGFISAGRKEITRPEYKEEFSGGWLNARLESKKTRNGQNLS